MSQNRKRPGINGALGATLRVPLPIERIGRAWRQDVTKTQLETVYHQYPCHLYRHDS